LAVTELKNKTAEEVLEAFLSWKSDPVLTEYQVFVISEMQWFSLTTNRDKY